jgi:LacI family gluconate utilization system Gnt-I transcriptional repressor
MRTRVAHRAAATMTSRRPTGRASITARDVARLAGVSPMTVSRVVNRPDSVPSATFAKVRDAIDKSGYVPNRLAGGLRSSKSHLVAAIVPTLTGSMFLETIESLTAHLAARGHQLMVGQGGYAEDREDALISDVIGRRPDGIVLTGVLHTPQARRRLAEAGIPVVETWDLTPHPIDVAIGFSHEGAAAAVCRFLQQKGRRRLVYAGGNDARAKRRCKAFVDTARLLGLVVPRSHFVAAPATLADGRRVLRALMARDPGIDAIFCTSDLFALGVLTEARKLGVDVPRQLAVVGFGDLAVVRDLEPPLTTVRIDGTEIGRLAAASILDREPHEGPRGRSIDVGFALLDRGSA